MAALRLAGKNILVTGASSGLGEHFARTLAANGASAIALLARRESRLTALADELQQRHPDLEIAVHAADLGSSQAEIHSAVEKAVGMLPGGRLDCLVNNAGVGKDGAVMSMQEDDWDELFDVNLKAAWCVAQATARLMMKSNDEESKSENNHHGSSIVNIASVAAEKVLPQLGPYCASKAALAHLTRSMAIEWARYSIRVNSLSPGYFRTEMNADVLDSPAGAVLAKMVPMRRLGEMRDLDGALLLLCGDEGRYMTGSNINVDGGMSV